MILVRTTPILELRSNAKSALVLNACELFDQAFSFRKLLSEIAVSIQGSGELELSLPEEQPGEDCVQGHASWAGRRFGVYFERPLGYLQFESEVHDDLVLLNQAMKPHIHVGM